MKTVWPVSVQMRRTSSCRVPRVSASSAENGSSIRRIFGSIDSAPRDADALSHAARQLGRLLRLGAGKADEVDEALRMGAHLLLRPFAPARGDGIGDIAHHATPRQQRMALEDHGAVEARAFDRLTIDEDGAVRRVVEPGQDVEHRRLAAAGMAE